jgi:hypothetical protein
MVRIASISRDGWQCARLLVMVGVGGATYNLGYYANYRHCYQDAEMHV